MVLAKTDQSYIGEHSEKIMAKRLERKSLTGKSWGPFNYDRGYDNAKEWHDARIAAVEKEKTKDLK